MATDSSRGAPVAVRAEGALLDRILDEECAWQSRVKSDCVRSIRRGADEDRVGTQPSATIRAH